MAYLIFVSVLEILVYILNRHFIATLLTLINNVFKHETILFIIAIIQLLLIIVFINAIKDNVRDYNNKI